jgi:co-chaperonin GroES (HSP10)
MKKTENLLPIVPMPNFIVVERLVVESKLAKSQREKAPELHITQEQIAKMNKEKLDSTHNILDVWDEHPLQGRVVAINKKQSDELNLFVGDKVGFRIDESVGMMMVVNGKKYMCLYQHDVLFKYSSNDA